MSDDNKIQFVRVATKDRPGDRFLTAQFREDAKNEQSDPKGDLYFLVEINNPWFPNSQIGQTIINTVVREYRRGENSSLLTNFEVALKKTNATLAQITQNGETDWIGNLSSVIMLVRENNLYLAQTGQAKVFLMREGKVSEVTEGLEEEANHHPLTTYTNITTGAMESGDRLLLATSMFGEHISVADLKSMLLGETLVDSANEIVMSLQRARCRKVNAFVLEYSPSSGSAGETIYLDQPLGGLMSSLKRFFSKAVLPAIDTTGRIIDTHAKNTGRWTREWLIPKTREFGIKSRAGLIAGGTKISRAASPLFKKAADNVKGRFNFSKTKTVSDNDAKYNVLHYNEKVKILSKKTTVDWKKVFSPFIQILSQIKMPRLAIPRFTRKQAIFLGVAVIAVTVIAITTSKRAVELNEEQKQVAAASALDEAKNAQRSAERYFALGQKEGAKTQFILAISKAEEASLNSDTETEAATIITQSQTILDEMMNASRLDSPVPITELSFVPVGISLTQNELVSFEAGNATAQITVITEEDGSTPVSLPSKISASNTNLIFNNEVIATGENKSLISLNPTTKTASSLTLSTGSWENAMALAGFGSNIYLLDQDSGQIWRHTAQGAQFGESKGYLISADPSGLKTAISLAIDGEVYVLHSTGSVQKYTRGELVTGWKLASAPTPWDKIISPLAIFTHSDSDRIFVLENKNDQQPARLLEFKKDGTFVSQLILPSDWQIQAWSFDPVSRSGAIVVNKRAYKLEFLGSVDSQ